MANPTSNMRKYNAAKTIYVTGIPKSADYSKVHETFRAFGAIEKMSFQERSAYSYAFVSFTSEATVKKVMASAGKVTIDGRHIFIKKRRFNDEGQPNNQSSGGASESNVNRQPGQKLPTGDKKKGNFNNRVPSPIHMHANIHDSLATKFKPYVPTEAIKTKKKDKGAAKKNNGSPKNQTKDLPTCHESSPTMMYMPNEGCAANGTSADQRESTPYVSTGTQVVRAANISASWTPSELYHHLQHSGYAIIAVLIYEDMDEKSLRQGLIQFRTAQDAAIATRAALLKTPRLQLTIFPSSVISIEAIKRNYCGRISAFCGSEVQDWQRPSVIMPTTRFTAPSGLLSSVCGQPLPSIKSEDVADSESSVSPTSSSPESQASPSSQASPDSIASPMDGKYSFEMTAQQMPGIFNGLARNRGTLSSGTMQMHTNMAQFQTIANQKMMKDSTLMESGTITSACGRSLQETTMTPMYGAAHTSMQAFLPISLPHNASRTVVVDNFCPNLAKDAHVLAASMSPFGSVETADLVPISATETRAYITFSAPTSAELALCKLGTCFSGKNRLKVRLA